MRLRSRSADLSTSHVTNASSRTGVPPAAVASVMQALAVAFDGKPFPAHAFNMVGVEILADPRSLIEMSPIAVAN